MKKLVLGTRSKRRIELLERLGVKPIVIPPRSIVEKTTGDPRDIVLYNARAKMESVLLDPRLPRENAVVITADTVIADPEGFVYGKPGSIEANKLFLERLRGRWHRVLTGVVVYDVDTYTMEEFVEETRVKMRSYSDREIELYTACLEGVDKAGGYALQGIGALLVEMIVGDPYNVIGLPLSRLHTVLLRHGVNLLEYALVRRVVKRL